MEKKKVKDVQTIGNTHVANSNMKIIYLVCLPDLKRSCILSVQSTFLGNLYAMYV